MDREKFDCIGCHASNPMAFADPDDLRCVVCQEALDEVNDEVNDEATCPRCGTPTEPDTLCDDCDEASREGFDA